MSKIIQILLPLAISLIGKYLKSRDDLKELDRDFVSFVQKLENQPNSIAKVSNKYEDALAKARAEAMKGKDS